MPRKTLIKLKITIYDYGLHPDQPTTIEHFIASGKIDSFKFTATHMGYGWTCFLSSYCPDNIRRGIAKEVETRLLNYKGEEN